MTVAAPPSTWWPFTAVHHDGEALYQALRVALPRGMPGMLPERAEVLDTSYQQGRMWQLLYRHYGIKPYELHRMDIKPEYGLDTCGNFLQLTRYFRDETWDMVAWDPPMASDSGKGIAGDEDWADRYGTDTDVPSDISVWFHPVVAGAWQLLRPGGLLFAKMSDQNHGGLSMWYHCQLWQAAIAQGFTACDLYVKVRPRGMVDPKWRRNGPRHAKKNHTFYWLFRKGAC